MFYTHVHYSLVHIKGIKGPLGCFSWAPLARCDMWLPKQPHFLPFPAWLNSSLNNFKQMAMPAVCRVVTAPSLISGHGLPVHSRFQPHQTSNNSLSGFWGFPVYEPSVKDCLHLGYVIALRSWTVVLKHDGVVFKYILCTRHRGSWECRPSDLYPKPRYWIWYCWFGTIHLWCKRIRGTV